MVYYYIFLSLLFIVYLLFAYELNLKIDISLDHLKVKLFFIPVFYVKGKKYRKFLKKLIPKDQVQVEKEFDISSLITLIHFKYLNIKIRKSIQDYVNYIYMVESISILNHMFCSLISNYVENYHFEMEPSEKNQLNLKAKFHFNIGIIILNLLIINRRYKNAQKAD